MEDLNPPVAEKAEKAPKAPKPPKATKAAKEYTVDPETGELVGGEDMPPAEKKPRAPRVDRGIRKHSVIHLTEKEMKLGGQRQEWYDRIKTCEGKTVAEFMAAFPDVKNGKGNPEPPFGWLRFFFDQGMVRLETSEEVAAA